MRSVALVSLSVLCACADVPLEIKEKKVVRSGLVVRRYRQSGGNQANIYYFDTTSGTIVVDSPLTQSEAKKLRNQIVQPYAIYISAARAERLGGLTQLREGDVKAYTTPAVRKEIDEKLSQRLAAFKNKDVPPYVEAPSPAVDERSHNIVGDVEVELMPMGPGPTDAALVLWLPRSGELIANDLVVTGEHADVSNGKSTQWLELLTLLKNLGPKHIYPGHGNPGGPEQIEEMQIYLKYFHDAVAEKVKSGGPPMLAAADVAGIKKKMLERYPKYDRKDLIEKSIQGEYAAQLAGLAPPPPPPAPAAAAPAEPAPGGASDLINAGDSGGKKKKKKGK